MAKRGSMTKYEIFFVKQNPDNLTIHELAKELDRTPNMIAKYYIDPEKKQEQQQKAIEENKPEPQMFALMGRHKRGDQNVATVMTKAASELADATRPIENLSQKLKSAIHRPKD